MDTFQVIENSELSVINEQINTINIKLKSIDDLKRRTNNVETDLKMNSFIKFKKDFYNITNKVTKTQKKLDNQIKNTVSEDLKDTFLDLNNKIYKQEFDNRKFKINILSCNIFFVVLCFLIKIY
jgi:hypothetical protein